MISEGPQPSDDGLRQSLDLAVSSELDTADWYIFRLLLGLFCRGTEQTLSSWLAITGLVV